MDKVNPPKNKNHTKTEETTDKNLLTINLAKCFKEIFFFLYISSRNKNIIDLEKFYLILYSHMCKFFSHLPVLYNMLKFYGIFPIGKFLLRVFLNSFFLVYENLQDFLVMLIKFLLGIKLFIMVIYVDFLKKIIIGHQFKSIFLWHFAVIHRISLSFNLIAI